MFLRALLHISDMLMINIISLKQQLFEKSITKKILMQTEYQNIWNNWKKNENDMYRKKYEYPELIKEYCSLIVTTILLISYKHYMFYCR